MLRMGAESVIIPVAEPHHSVAVEITCQGNQISGDGGSIQLGLLLFSCAEALVAPFLLLVPDVTQLVVD